VTVEHAGKSQHYRCVFCALADAKDLVGDLTVLAASDKKGEPVRITRTAGKWAIAPSEAVFVFAEGSHEQCQSRYRALLSRESFNAYARQNGSLLGKSKPVTLEQLLQQVK
jgi:hypothetical protein